MEIKKNIVPVITPPATYDIVGLTETEVEDILSVFGMVGGPNLNSPRFTTERIYNLFLRQGLFSRMNAIGKIVFNRDNIKR